MAIKRNAAGKIIAKRFTMERIEEAANLEQGLCLACGETCDCCEPDARKYKCEGCGLSLVYGAEEVAIMGYVR